MRVWFKHWFTRWLRWQFVLIERMGYLVDATPDLGERWFTIGPKDVYVVCVDDPDPNREVMTKWHN